MRTHKTKKAGKFRGGKTHGYGSMKKNRGAGHRGGVGLAGTGKRSDTKKPSFWKSKYFGKNGFKRKNKIPLKTVNISFIERFPDRFSINKETKQGIELNLAKEGYDKLLGTGRPTRKYMIKVDYASKRAIEKIKEAGGTIEMEIAKLRRPATKSPKIAKEQ